MIVFNEFLKYIPSFIFAVDPVIDLQSFLLGKTEWIPFIEAKSNALHSGGREGT
jgi:hypothetical protein